MDAVPASSGAQLIWHWHSSQWGALDQLILDSNSPNPNPNPQRQACPRAVPCGGRWLSHHWRGTLAARSNLAGSARAVPTVTVEQRQALAMFRSEAGTCA